MSNQSNHRSNTKVRTLALSLLTGATLFSCQLDEMEIPQEELYLREFIKEYGVFDKSQDWNLAKRESVTVKVGSTSRVKVYAYWEGKRYIFADYENVSGTQTLGFDLPKGIDDIIVKVNGVQKNAKVGDTVDFTGGGNSGSRTTYEGTTSTSAGDITITRTDSEYWLELDKEDVTVYREILPESNEANNPDKFNLGKVTQNFLYVSQGPFVIYPIYWQTSRQNTLGVYTYNDDGTRNEIDVYQIKSGDELQYATEDSGSDKTEERETNTNELSKVTSSGSTNPNDWTEEDWVKVKAEMMSSNWEWLGGTRIKSITVTSMTENSFKFTSVLSRYNWQNSSGGETSYSDSYIKWRSKGIIIDIPKGTEFGMYIKTGKETFYSEKALNPDSWGPAPDYWSDDDKACHAATYVVDKDTENEHLILGFEDWVHQQNAFSDMDLNDVIIRVQSLTPASDTSTIPDIEDEDVDEKFTWILAVEDLGNTDDFDFNDIVVSVEHVSGRPNALVTALAAGGTLPIYLYFGEQNINDGKEYHTWFDNGTIPSSTMINTGAGPTATGKQYEITVDANNWSLAPNTTVDNEKNNMGGFHVKVERPDGIITDLKAPVGSEGDIVAPQMICVPGTWKWPKERTGIHEAYTGFNDWCQNKEANKDWYNSPVSGTVFGE